MTKMALRRSQRPRKRPSQAPEALVDENNAVTGIAELLGQAKAAVGAAEDLAALDAVRVRFLGKKGLFTAQLHELGKLPPDQIKVAGKAVNDAKTALAAAIETRREALEAKRVAAQLAAEALDVTLPGRGETPGHLHPVTRTLRRMVTILGHAGFDVHTGPEVEDDFHNFTALNIPEDHPARAMHDTFYLRSGLLLRTHTSPVQIRALREHGAPIRLIAPGRVYRRDSDLTHTPMFTQVEGLAIDRDISFANLKALLYDFVSKFFEREVQLRFRPSYFPFTEPSAEVDVLSDSGRWLEILGCGMVHPNVLRNVGVDPTAFTGYAFGMGVERLTMLRYGVDDLRSFFENDLRLLEQFD
jgi:phenylalanyl-tRNA synthetase alpha chain